jgi:hypothetical protein
MLLISSVAETWRRSLYRVLGAVLWFTCSSLFSASGSECFVGVPVYDGLGNKLPFVISGVFKAGERGLGDLLQLQDKRYGLRAVGERLYFNQPAIGAELDVKLSGPSGATTTTQVAINACRQRSSVQYGQLDSGADVRTSTLTGHLSGCKVDGDWWIKAMPMFGEYAQMGAYDGIIGADGVFEIVASMRGGRYIVVVGKDREPVKAFSAEISVGAKNLVGTVDMRGFCPK